MTKRNKKRKFLYGEYVAESFLTGDIMMMFLCDIENEC